MYTSKKILSLILNLVVLSACGAMPEASSALNKVGSSPEQENAIRNGEPISREEYPEVGALTTIYGDAVCTGTLIAPDIVLTAAHCVDFIQPETMHLYGFSLDHDVTAKERPDHFVEIDAVIMHPEYTKSGIVWYQEGPSPHSFADLALLRLAAPIELPDFTPVLQQDSKLFSSFPVLTSVGYGNNDSVSSSSEDDIGGGIKRKANLGFRGLVNGQQDGEGAPVYQDAVVISTPLINIDANTCQGDSGGPIFATLAGTQYLVGVASMVYGYTCSDYYAATHTNPVAFKSWLTEALVQLDHPWNNPRQKLDVNNDGFITPLDALMIINQLNKTGAIFLSESHLKRAPRAPYIDTNGDNYVTPLDALLVINYLNYGMEAKVSTLAAEASSVENSPLEAKINTQALAAFFSGNRSEVDLAFDEFTYALNQDKQFLNGSDYVLNFGGRDGKWLHSETLGWTFIVPDGRLYDFSVMVEGKAVGTLITTLMPRHYADPSLLHSAKDPHAEQASDHMSITIMGIE